MVSSRRANNVREDITSDIAVEGVRKLIGIVFYLKPGAGSTTPTP